MPLHPSSRRKLHLAAIICVAILVVANVLLIFSFSSESREESGSRSREVTVVVARPLTPSFDEMPPAEQNAVVDHYHHYVRKAAHFLEFALLGFLTACLVQLIWSYGGNRLILWQTMGIPALFCLLCAISDEVYQIFTNRGPAVADVGIDFCGAACGVIFLHLCGWLITRILRHKAGKEAARV